MIDEVEVYIVPVLWILSYTFHRVREQIQEQNVYVDFFLHETFYEFFSSFLDFITGMKSTHAEYPMPNRTKCLLSHCISKLRLK